MTSWICRPRLPLLLGAVLASLAFAPPEEPASDPLVLPLVRPDGTPLTALALAGREVFVREGCGVCHAVADRGYAVRVAAEELQPLPGARRAPTLWGRGGTQTDRWHVEHLLSPAQLVHRSVMPAFAHLAAASPSTPPQRVVMLARAAGGEASQTPKALQRAMRAEAKALVQRVVADGGKALPPDSDLVALVAWLQQLTPPTGALVGTPLPGTPATFDEDIHRDAQALAKAGGESFARLCTPCHGNTGSGGVGPSLTDALWRYGRRPADVFRSIADGRTALGMPAFATGLSVDELRALTAYVAVTLGTQP